MNPDEFTFDAHGRCTNPGKFEGERRELIAAYDLSLDGFGEGFGDADTFGFYFAVTLDDGTDVFGVINSAGFVNEIDEAEFNAERGAWEEEEEEEGKGDD